MKLPDNSMLFRIGCDNMKIEKINDNQIRCTDKKTWRTIKSVSVNWLTALRKPRNFFRDMMQQAQIQFGFEADNIPLMIEAIPVSTESIILIITKVEDLKNWIPVSPNLLHSEGMIRQILFSLTVQIILLTSSRNFTKQR